MAKAEGGKGIYQAGLIWIMCGRKARRDMATLLKYQLAKSPHNISTILHGVRSWPIQVNPQETSYHNLRAAPSLFSPIVGTLEAYDVVEVAQTLQLHGGEAGEEVRKLRGVLNQTNSFLCMSAHVWPSASQSPLPNIPETTFGSYACSGGSRIAGSGAGVELWAQLLRRSAGPAAWSLVSDESSCFLQKLKSASEALEKPKDWVPNDLEEPPIGEAVNSLNFLMAASLNQDGEMKEILEAVASHELQLGRESGAVKLLEAEAHQLRSEALAAERELLQRQGDRTATLRRFQRVKQQEAWNAACAQIEQQQAQAEEILEDAVDDAEALCQARLELQRAGREEQAPTRRKKAVGRLGRQLLASAGLEQPAKEKTEKNDSHLVGAMASMETLVGQRMLQVGRPLSSLEEVSKPSVWEPEAEG